MVVVGLMIIHKHKTKTSTWSDRGARNVLGSFRRGPDTLYRACVPNKKEKNELGFYFKLKINISFEEGNVNCDTAEKWSLGERLKGRIGTWQRNVSRR